MIRNFQHTVWPCVAVGLAEKDRGLGDLASVTGQPKSVAFAVPLDESKQSGFAATACLPPSAGARIEAGRRLGQAHNPPCRRYQSPIASSWSCHEDNWLVEKKRMDLFAEADEFVRVVLKQGMGPGGCCVAETVFGQGGTDGFIRPELALQAFRL